MSGAFDNIHPTLSFEGALNILAEKENNLKCSSDYYMAVSHLLNFPCQRTEDVLLGVASNESDSQAVRLARRKSVEVLGRFGCKRALPILAKCLDHSDRYLVENAVWSLLQIGCQDPTIHQRLIGLLDEDQGNQRIIIQCLAGLAVRDATDMIQKCLKSPVVSVQTAAGSALCRLLGDRSYVSDLKPVLFSASQMDRQMVIEDLADCKGIELIDSVLKSPVSPVFRMRFVQAVSSEQSANSSTRFSLIDKLDQILVDSPKSLLLSSCFDGYASVKDYFDGLFSNDFARCYHCLGRLSDMEGRIIWPIFLQKWYESAFNDYGAHYFFLRLVGLASGWPAECVSRLEDILLEAVDNRRPQFSKSRHIALLSYFNLSPEKITADFLLRIIEPSDRSWQLQYAVLMIAEQLQVERVVLLHEYFGDRKTTSLHPFVQAKLIRFLS